MRLTPLIALLTLFSACSPASDPSRTFAAEQLLSPDDRHRVMMPIVSHLGEGHRLDLIHIDSLSNTTYFLVTKPARSLYEKRIAIGGRYVVDASDSLTHFEETFRTWKMTEDRLVPKSAFLFGKMVDGADLTPWTPEHSGDEEYIEFPNSTITYDIQLRRWTSSAHPS